MNSANITMSSFADFAAAEGVEYGDSFSAMKQNGET